MQSDLYTILGLTSSATQEEVKKRYRTLARQYHPDVNKSDGAATKIQEINAAYEILGDSEKRTAYDAERLLNQRATPQAPPSPPPPTPPPPPKPDPNFNYNGFGRTQTTEPPPTTEKPKQRPKPPPPRAEPFVEEARLAFVNRDFKAAEGYCQQALGIDPRNAECYEILGDICMKRGQRDRALTCYTFAVQHAPNRIGLREKLERAAGTTTNTRPNRPNRPIINHRQTSWVQSLLAPERRDGVIVVLVTLLFGSLVGTVAWLRLDPGTPLLGEISLNAMVGLLIGGVQGGMLLGFLGRMRPMQEETSENHLGKLARRWLLGSAIFWFYFSLVGYMVVVINRRQVSYSLLRVYGLTLLLILLFVVAYTPLRAPSSTLQIATFGGNLLFPMLLVGWSLADRLRLR